MGSNPAGRTKPVDAVRCADLAPAQLYGFRLCVAPGTERRAVPALQRHELPTMPREPGFVGRALPAGFPAFGFARRPVRSGQCPPCIGASHTMIGISRCPRLARYKSAPVAGVAGSVECLFDKARTHVAVAHRRVDVFDHGPCVRRDFLVLHRVFKCGLEVGLAALDAVRHCGTVG